MEDTHDARRRLATIKTAAPIAAMHKAGYEHAIAEEQRARRALLDGAVEAARPALEAFAGKGYLKLRESRTGCARHRLPRRHVESAGLRAFDVIEGSVALVHDEDGWSWYYDALGGAQTCEDKACFTWQWTRVPTERLLRAFSLVDLVRGIETRIGEHLNGGMHGRARLFESRAAKLRALALLLGEPER